MWQTIFFSCFFVSFLFLEDLTRAWNKLSLDEREGSRFVLKNQLRSLEFIIATKFLTKCVLNMEVVAGAFRQLWRSTDGFKFKIRNLDDHLYSKIKEILIKFSCLNHGVLTSIWWSFKNMTTMFLSVTYLSSRPPFGFKFTTYPSGT